MFICKSLVFIDKYRTNRIYSIFIVIFIFYYKNSIPCN